MEDLTLIFLLWLICGAISAGISDDRTGDKWTGFWLGFLLGPLGVLGCYLFVGKGTTMTPATKLKKCPMCAELVQPEALICKHCGHRFEEAVA